MTAAAGRSEMMLELQAMQTPAGGSPLRLGDCLAESSILRLDPGSPPEQVFRDLIATLRLPNPGQALQMVLERERGGGTDIGSGVRMPHARLPGLPTIKAALGLSPAGPTRVWVLVPRAGGEAGADPGVPGQPGRLLPRRGERAGPARSAKRRRRSWISSAAAVASATGPETCLTDLVRTPMKVLDVFS